MQTIISEGNSKLGDIPNISMTPILSCCREAPCREYKHCYAVKFTKIYPNVAKNWMNNYQMARFHRDTYFTDIANYLRINKSKRFRWHVGGDILDQDYLKNMFDIAKSFPNTKFLAFTKKHGLNFSNKPSNLTIVFSMWNDFGDTKKPFPHAWVYDKKNPDTRIPMNSKNCKNNCSNCFICWNLKKGESVVFEKH